MDASASAQNLSIWPTWPWPRASEFHSHKLDLQNPSNAGWHFCDVEGRRTRFSLIFFSFPRANRRTRTWTNDARSLHLRSHRFRSSLSLNYGLIYRRLSLPPLLRSFFKIHLNLECAGNSALFVFEKGDRIRYQVRTAIEQVRDGPSIFNEALISERATTLLWIRGD